MDDMKIYFPISGTVIAIVVLMPILAIFGGLEQLRRFLFQHAISIIIIISIISLILSIIPAITNKSCIYILSGIILTSQLLFYVFMGCDALEIYTHYSYLKYIWGIILFALWVLFGTLNLCVTYITLGLNCIFSFKEIKHKEDKILSKWIGSILGTIGWVINLFIFVIL